MIGKKSKMSLRNKCTLYKVCIRPVMTYAAPVFATPTQRHSINFKFCKTISAEEPPAHPAANHPNPLLQSAVSYEPASPHHFIRRPRNVLSDPPDELTAEVERAITCRRHSMPIGGDRRSPQSSNSLGLRTTANQQVASGVFWSVRVGHSPRTRVRG
ncbi:hypothetical protein EVAR_94925_1 [Eumeta japonica]|uniref:Uncharacterized protein n=1 Tax=Eumeta variegata TaxID=151549 RepID=A0A4C1Z7Z4_EUMVA|nr:hypothetical protein EVAR_94925_1 [Eumeta japonica]